MQYRPLGRTGVQVSAIGLGCAQLMSPRTEYAVRVVRRAMKLGVNYFDTARGYGDSETKLGLALEGRRAEVVVSTKTGAKTRDEAAQHLRDSLARLRTDYLDNCHLHGLGDAADQDARLGSGGALEALVEAREQGLVRHIGCSSHRSAYLVQALQRFDFEVILVPMNLVEREPLDELVPLCLERGVGLTIMKPVATGLLPARLALKWLLAQPIACAVPGATTLEEVEENSRVGHLEDPALTAEELEQAAAWSRKLEHRRCRVCGECQPCPVEVPIGMLLGTDVPFDHYRTMGPAAFSEFPWSVDTVKAQAENRRRILASLRACDRCGDCERRCPYGLPVVDMLKRSIAPMEDMLRIWQERFAA
jgi:aryl-alcohol dehydrogenase-like predicted oxidoreductase